MSDHQSIAEAVLAEVNASAESAPAVEEAPAVEAAPVEVVDDQADGGDVELEEADGSRRRLSWSEAMERVPPDIRRLMRDMQADYTRKTQEVAEQRREVLRERQALLKGKAALAEDRELPEYDPFDESTIQARIEREVARRLREVLDPMESEYQAMQAEDAYQTFLTENPDFKTDQALRDQVQAMLEANENLDLETAYWAAKGRRAREAAATERESASARRRAAREAAMTGTGAPRRAGAAVRRPQRAELKNMSAADILKLAESMNRQS